MNVNFQRKLNLCTAVYHNGRLVRLTFSSNHNFYDPKVGSISVAVNADGKAQLISSQSNGIPNEASAEWNDRLRQLCQKLFDGQITPDGQRIRYVSENPIIAESNKLIVFAYPKIDINEVLDFVRPIVVAWLDPCNAYEPSQRDVDDLTIAVDRKPVHCQSCQHPCLLRRSCSHWPRQTTPATSWPHSSFNTHSADQNLRSFFITSHFYLCLNAHKLFLLNNKVCRII